jgi:hypothetical protein
LPEFLFEQDDVSIGDTSEEVAIAPLLAMDPVLLSRELYLAITSGNSTKVRQLSHIEFGDIAKQCTYKCYCTWVSQAMA